MGRLHTTATSPTDLHGILAGWIEGTGEEDLGWTLVDTVSATDTVYSISGEGGTRPTIYIRMTLNVYDEAPGGMPIGNQDNITFRLYRSWNTGTHTGKGETGRIGPRVIFKPSYNQRPWLRRLGLFLPVSEVWTTEPNLWSDLEIDTSGAWQFNGRGVYFLNKSLNVLCFYDFTSSSISVISHLPDDSPGTLLILTNKPDGSEYLWAMTAGSGLDAMFKVYDVQNDTWSSPKTDPPWGNSYYDYRPWAWDGGDTVFMVQGQTIDSAGSVFAKYSISGDTWTTLATVPYFSDWNGGDATPNYSRMVYVPASLSGHTHDEIYMIFLEGTGYYWSRYDVTTDTWVSSPSPLATLPHEQIPYGTMMWLDPTIGNHGTIFALFANPSTYLPGDLYAYDIDTNTWGTQISSFTPENDIYHVYGGEFSMFSTPFSWIRTQAGALYLPASTDDNIRVEAIGDDNFISVVAQWFPLSGAEIHRWAYAGFYHPYMKSDKFTASSGFSSGQNILVDIDEPVTGLLKENDFIEIYDPAANVVPQAKGQPYVAGGGEVCRIVYIAGAHSIMLEDVRRSYSAGVLLGQDIASAVVGNDCQMFCALRGENGFYFSGEGDLYNATPLIDKTRATSFGKRSVSILSGLQLSQGNPAVNTYNTVGELYGIWTANVLSDLPTYLSDYEYRDGKTFFIFSPQTKWRLRQGDARNFEIGPILPYEA